MIWGLETQKTQTAPTIGNGTAAKVVNGFMIERGVELTPSRKNETGVTDAMREVINKMQVGDSFLCTKRQANLAFLIARNAGLVVKSRTIPNQTGINEKERIVRVWMLGRNPDSKIKTKRNGVY